MFLVLLTFMREDDSAHVVTQLNGFTGRRPKGFGHNVGSLLSQQHGGQDDGTPHSADRVTGSHSSYSRPSFPGSSDLESSAPATSLWPPNASLLFCQKEVLMLLT